MTYIYVRQNVEDYARWKEGFDNHVSARQAGGATDEAYVMRNVDDPNDITVILGWNDLEKARTFTQSASLKEAMQKAGVTGPPEIRFLEAAG
jgi:heme-degrading monooxygenase HmoA